MLDLYDEFKSVINALERRGVDYALCGGLAMAVHGLARATVDIDMLIESKSFADLQKVARECGYSVSGLPMSFAKGLVEIRRFTKIDPGSGAVLPLDLILVTPALEEVWDSRERVEWEHGNLWVVSREGLVTMKGLRGSGQDIDDIEHLKGH